MRAGDLKVVVVDRDPGKDRVDQGLAARPAGRIGQLHPDEQLGGGDGGDGHVVVVPDQLVQGLGARARRGLLLDWKVRSQRGDLGRPVGVGLVIPEQPLDLLAVGRRYGTDAGNRLSSPGDDICLAVVLDAVEHLRELAGGVRGIHRLHR
jgi:hypothetical protein